MPDCKGAAMKKTPKTMRQTGYQLRGLFLLMALVLLLSAAVTFLVGRRVMVARDEVQARDEVLQQLQSVFSTVQDAESGQRGYLLTGEKHYLPPYREAVEDIDKRFAGLRELAPKVKLQAEQVASLDRLIQRKLAELARTVDLTERGQRNAALGIVRADSGKERMDEIRGIFKALEREQEDARTRAHLTVSSSTFMRTAVFLAAALLNLAFLGWAYSRLRREMSLQYVAALETERQREILAVTLSSIGDAVIITDTRGHITFINKVAEELTGWMAAEAEDLPCVRVFRIINEETRAPVESPVDKVLATGAIVGLANHTLLIRKDGTEVPIDDSGAPIRESDGMVRGVVLVFRDFSTHKETERTLVKAKEAVEAASRAKDEFLATLSHELRTPLTPVVVTLSAWETGNRLPEELREDLRLVRRNVELEARLIDDLLDLTRIEHGKLSLEKAFLDANGLIGDVVELFLSDAKAKGMRIEVSCAAKKSVVEADPARLHQVFRNIVGNAVKFGAAGGTVRVLTADGPDSQLEIVIEDDGPGMSEETLGRLFQRFHQGAEAGKFCGLGLGLSIARALVEAHGGRISASSGGLGKGSRFTVRLPAVEPPATRTAPSVRQPAAGQQSLRILLLEDHPDTAQALGQVLRGMGHLVEIRGTVAGALEAAAAAAFDLILSDIGLPDGTGLDFIRKVREKSRTPAVALTGYGMAEDVESCLAAGFDGHLTKPVDFDKLRKTLERMAGLIGQAGRCVPGTTDWQDWRQS